MRTLSILFLFFFLPTIMGPSGGRKSTPLAAVCGTLEPGFNLSGIISLNGRLLATLSGGQEARVSLLRALVAEPEAVLLDEPIAKRDQGLRNTLQSFIFSQIALFNIPALLVTHDPDDAPGKQVLHLERRGYHA
jgi:ABC-type uncharacterized transport system YnjBCD ATPase subunit